MRIYWRYDSARRIMGCGLIALENVPVRFYDKIMLGRPGASSNSTT